MLRIFTLKFQSPLGAFDDAELQAFIKDKEVVSIRDHFFTKDDMPYLVVLVTEEKRRFIRLQHDTPGRLWVSRASAIKSAYPAQ